MKRNVKEVLKTPMKPSVSNVSFNVDYSQVPTRLPLAYEKLGGKFGNAWMNSTSAGKNRILFDTLVGIICKKGHRDKATVMALKALQLFMEKYGKGTTGHYLDSTLKGPYVFGFFRKPHGKGWRAPGIQEEEFKEFRRPLENLPASKRSLGIYGVNYFPGHIYQPRVYPLIATTDGEIVIGKAHEATRLGGQSRSALTRVGLNEASTVQVFTALRWIVDQASPAVELISTRQGGTTLRTPVALTPHRQASIALHNLVSNANKRKGSKSFICKLSEERFEVASGVSRNATLKAKKEQDRLGLANRGQIL